MPVFERDDTETIISEFRRLAIQEGWKKKSKIYKEERKKFIGKAAVEDFEKEFGTNAGSLQSWQSLCKRLELLNDDDELPTSIKQCKAILKGVYVNLVDLVDARKANGTVNIFGSPKELSKYIKRTKKMFPREKAKSSPLLKQFLITVT
ncbi:hypothetical protein HETIRDRAFT_470084 [Heterobasidion irregulare TC 32-1]|uniref:Uncharacterized protein n=1 Tax=Heterobasidion irregulare (strain TC 32-1) TaxID=747525 RepID=W4KIW8_HETIT|nr:uncharacterized protein HETIRDRAFT_470084 [Heterobasidion irregulare TC 32-1]ETW85016.1 hypothetical protein HETIRDRAFT_470084 [Heterobasidion irregulare TC 32-1]